MTVWLNIARIIKNPVQTENPCFGDDNPVKDNAAARHFDETADKDGNDNSASVHDDGEDDKDFGLVMDVLLLC